MSLVTKQDQLLEICELIRDKKIAAIDTEFIRETTYLPILCLIQINVDGVCYAVDALSGLDLSPFFEILNDPTIIKIFHSARQDMEVLSYSFSAKNNSESFSKFSPRETFDTQIMAALCGLGFAASYSGLSKSLLDQDVAKDWQRSDWCKRPLHPEQIAYAKMDVLYLPQIYQILRDKLIQEKKLDWATQEMESSVKQAIAPDDLCRKFSFANKNSVYQENINLLVRFRDDAARKHNVPRSFVLKDEVIDKIAYYNPNDVEALEKCGFKTRVSGQNIKEDILALMLSKTSQMAVKPSDDEARLSFRMSETQKEIYQKSRILLQEKAKEYQINPELIINQTNLQNLILGHKSVADILSSWRYIVFGEELEKLILHLSS